MSWVKRSEHYFDLHHEVSTKVLDVKIEILHFHAQRLVRTSRTGDVRRTADGTSCTIRLEGSLPDIGGDQFDHQRFGIFIRDAFDIAVRYFADPCG